MNYFPFRFSFEQEIVQFAQTALATSTQEVVSMNFTEQQLPRELLDKINSEFDLYNLPSFNNVNIWRKPPGYIQSIHIDPWMWDVLAGKTNTLSSTQTAINIPVEGIGTGKMFWFDGKYKVQVSSGVKEAKQKQNNLSKFDQVKIPNGHVVFYIDWEEEGKIVEELVLDQTYVIRVGVPHQVVIDKEIRTVASIRLKNNPSFDEVRKCLIPH